MIIDVVAATAFTRTKSRPEDHNNQHQDHQDHPNDSPGLGWAGRQPRPEAMLTLLGWAGLHRRPAAMLTVPPKDPSKNPFQFALLGERFNIHDSKKILHEIYTRRGFSIPCRD